MLPTMLAAFLALLPSDHDTGQRFDIGGAKLYLNCRGDVGPTVVDQVVEMGFRDRVGERPFHAQESELDQDGLAQVIRRL